MRGWSWSNSAPTPVNADVYAYSSRIIMQVLGIESTVANKAQG